MNMTKRLQVLLEDDELREIQALAKRRRQTTAAFVREALRQAQAATVERSVESRIRAIREAAATYSFPVGDIETIKSEIERGFLGNE